MWKKYLAWSDKINKPFYENRRRLALYVILVQTILVTVALFKLTNPSKQEFACLHVSFEQMRCFEL